MNKCPQRKHNMGGLGGGGIGGANDDEPVIALSVPGMQGTSQPPVRDKMASKGKLLFHFPCSKLNHKANFQGNTKPQESNSLS